MNDSIILTDTRENGVKLKDALSDYLNVEVFVKNDLLAAPTDFSNVKVVFSSWNMPRMTEDEISKIFPSLKIIFYAAGSTKYFAEPFLNCGISIYDASKANGIPVADFVVGQILLANKGYYQSLLSYKRAYRGKKVAESRMYSYCRPGNYKSKIGIIGCGNIGARILERLSSYDLALYFCDPNIQKEAFQEFNACKSSMEWIFSNCDVITNHLPNIDALQDVINYDLLCKMKETATFINTGRGAQVNEKDLIRVMKEKPMACALLDVTKSEGNFPPPLFLNIFKQKNIFLTPHIAGSTGNEYFRLVDYIISLHKKYIGNRLEASTITKDSLKLHT